MSSHDTILYSRQGCHLCDDALAILRRNGLTPRLVDIDADPQLAARYGTSVPVVEIDGRERFRGHVNEVLLRRILADASRSGILPLPENDSQAEAVEHLGIFAKHWAPGKVKTRLAAAIGPAAASDVYRRFLETLVARFGELAARRTLAYAPPEACEEFAFLAAKGWRLWPQPSGDLGTRMEQFFSTAFASGAQRVVLIGSDSPTLPTEYLREAFERLLTCDVVLGPTPDGGYYLVGASHRAPPIFEGISWSSPTVWRQTVDRLTQAGCRYFALPPWYDVDEIGDLRRLAAELAEMPKADAAWGELRRAVQRALEDDQREDGLQTRPT